MQLEQVLVLVVMVLTIGGSTYAAEIRIVGGKSVDVEPVIDWLAKPKGERPMPHWKKIHVTEWLEMIGQQTKCIVTVDGKSKTVLLANLKPEAAKRLARVAYLKAYIPKETERMKNEELHFEHLQATMPRGRTKRSLGKQDSIALKHDKMSLHERISESKKLLAEVKADWDLAMYTGVNYAGLEAWDCGVRPH